MAAKRVWVTPNAFSKEVGVSAQAVSNAIETGRFQDNALKHEKTKTGKPRVKIHLERGKQQWETNKGGKLQVTEDEGKQARLREQIARAEIEEMKALEMAGELIRAEEVKRHFTKIALVVRDGVLSQAVKMAPTLVDVDNPKELENKLLEGLTEILEELSDAGRSGTIFK